MLNLLKGLWFDGELYKFHRWFHMICILIMQLRGASFILRMKSRVLLHSEVGMIMVSICLHGVISWSQASGRGRFGPTKTVIDEQFHPFVSKFCLTWTVYNMSNKMTKFYDDVYSFERVRGCQFLSFTYRCLRNGWSHRNGCWRWANPKCACVWRQLGDKNSRNWNWIKGIGIDKEELKELIQFLFLIVNSFWFFAMFLAESLNQFDLKPFWIQLTRISLDRYIILYDNLSIKWILHGSYWPHL